MDALSHNPTCLRGLGGGVQGRGWGLNWARMDVRPLHPPAPW